MHHYTVQIIFVHYELFVMKMVTMISLPYLTIFP
jgi:hypothetical protein